MGIYQKKTLVLKYIHPLWLLSISNQSIVLSIWCMCCQRDFFQAIKQSLNTQHTFLLQIMKLHNTFQITTFVTQQGTTRPTVTIGTSFWKA